jgi:hypothetical protein
MTLISGNIFEMISVFGGVESTGEDFASCSGGFDRGIACWSTFKKENGKTNIE